MDGRMQLCRSQWVQGLPASSCWDWEVEGCLLACRICALVEDLCQEEKLLLEEVCRFCSIGDIRERLIGSSLRSWRYKNLNLQLYWKEGPSESILNRFGNGDSFDVQGWKQNFWRGVLLFLILKRISQLGMWRSGQAWLQWPWDSEVQYPESICAICRVDSPGFQETSLHPVQEKGKCFAWKNLMGGGPAEKRGPGKPVAFQGSPPPKTVHPNMQKVKQQ